MNWEEEEIHEAEERTRDTKIDEAKDGVLKLLEENATSVFYIKQVQVLLEKRFFHWITGRGVGELIDEGGVGYEDVRLRNGKARFIFARGHRYRERQIKQAVKAIEGYSVPNVARASGHWAEVMFLVALMEYGFSLHGRDTRAYEGKVWKATEHNLDFIVSRDGAVYGAEVKNTWDYIPSGEFRLKLDMCVLLGIVPLFIWRYAPKNYMFELSQKGGYGMIFKAHIFPLGCERLSDEIEERLGLECRVPRRIPDGILERFMRWHRKRVGV